MGDLRGVLELAGESNLRMEIQGGSGGPQRQGVLLRTAAAAALAKVAASEQRESAWKVLQRDAATGWGQTPAERASGGDAFGIAESSAALATPRILPVAQRGGSWDLVRAGSRALISGGLGGEAFTRMLQILSFFHKLQVFVKF